MGKGQGPLGVSRGPRMLGGRVGEEKPGRPKGQDGGEESLEAFPPTPMVQRPSPDEGISCRLRLVQA